MMKGNPMSYKLLPCDREEEYPMPPSLCEWFPKGDLAWFSLDAVGQMELGEFYAAYQEDGGVAGAGCGFPGGGGERYIIISQTLS